MKSKRHLKLVGSACMAVILALTLVFTISCASPEGDVYKIGIFQTVIHPALDAARQGFKDALTAAVLAKGGNVTYDEQEAAGEPGIAVTIAESFVAEGVDLICAINTSCAQAAALAANETDIPVVFSSVTNPVVAGIVNNWTVPGGQVTGISDIVPVEPQLQLIVDILEDVANNLTFETLGVIYSPAEATSVFQVDVQLPAAIESLALNISVVESPAYSTAEVSAAAEALVGQVDAIWIPTDNTVVAAFEAVVLVAEDNDIPLFTADVATIEVGAIGCWGLDYYDVGYMSGEIAALILLMGANPATMPVQTVPADWLYLYPQAGERMGVTIPQWLIDMAHEVVED
jgi:putative ABC transport system substrate-binding protein